ncbi:uncharacterized protein [Clytia hemisphaerica]|uniref:uncharacterized protein n=1 Tax=Clytia hemisphaerica TaxID=252671 RepID=UPI0034D650C5
MTDLKKNSFLFNKENIQNYTRKNAYESKDIYTKRSRFSCVEKLQPGREKNNIFSLKCIPEDSELVKWSEDLGKHKRLAAGNYVINYDRGLLDYDDVGHLLTLHRIQTIKRAVGQEIAWLNKTKVKPKNINEVIQDDVFAKFKNLLWCTPPADLPGIPMSPSILSELCGKRFLNTDHMLFVAAMLNSQQSDYHVCYLNYLGDFKKYFSREHPKSCKEIIFLINVGIFNSKTFLGKDGLQGNHWSMAIYSKGNKSLTYYDSLGWNIPEDLPGKITSIFGQNNIESIKSAHDPEAHKNGCKSCSFECLPYPLQTCGNVCGPITLVMCSIFCLDNDRFKSTIESYDDCYLRKPTKYNGFLRLKLASWYCNGKIDTDSLFSNTDCLKTKIVASSSNQVDDSKTAIPFVPEPEVKLKSTVDSKIKETSNSKFKCPSCSTTFTKKANMMRHISNKHSKDVLSSVSSGNCVCFECDFKCRRIVELRKHLVSNHGFTEECESLNFKNFEGVFILQIFTCVTKDLH